MILFIYLPNILFADASDYCAAGCFVPSKGWGTVRWDMARWFSIYLCIDLLVGATKIRGFRFARNKGLRRVGYGKAGKVRDLLDTLSTYLSICLSIYPSI